MLGNLSHELKLIASGVTIEGASISWFSERLGKASHTQVRAELGEEDIVNLLTQTLYSYYYSVSTPRLIAEVDSLRQNAPSVDLTSSLVAGAPGKGRWEPGWMLRGGTKTPGVVGVEKDGLFLSVEEERVRSVPPLTELSHAAQVEVLTPHHSMNRSAGFYVVHSDVNLNYDAAIARFYMNCHPDDAPEVLSRTATQLNDRALPFDLKVAKNSNQFYRSDVMVLYVPQDCLGQVWKSLCVVIENLPFQLRDSLPAMVRPMARGVGLAADPADGHSFGMSRCRIIAKGLAQVRSPDVDARLEAIQEEFAASNIDLDFPYATSAKKFEYSSL